MSLKISRICDGFRNVRTHNGGKKSFLNLKNEKPDKPTKIKVSQLKSISLLIYSQPVVWSVKLSKAQTEYKIFN